ncbi:MAG: dihydrolipoamide acetyltransferase family protein [Dehalococcoidia bacterium]|nr:dihydrolipoamide acetyltransferase family protein [Dehalococcoidia bacterium]
MATTVHIPKVGMTMEEGDLVRWLVDDGATVEAGQPIFEMETEKVEVEVEVEDAGVLKQFVPAGTKLRPGAVVGCVLAGGESEVPQTMLDEVAQQWSQPVSGGGGTAAPAAASAAPPAAAAPSTPSPAPAPPPARAPGERVVATPVARRLAREHSIEIGEIAGSGSNGRITEADVQAHIDGGGAPATPAATAPAASDAPAEAPTVPYSGRRRTIGERMRASLQQSAQLTLFSDADAEPASTMLHALNREWRSERVVVTLTPLVMRACALALRDHPQLNSRLEGDTIVIEPEVNVGFATDLEAGLMVPVVPAVDAISLQDLARAVAEQGERAGEDALTLDDVSGGTFTVTSLATLPIDGFTPVLNPPQSAILGVGRVRDVARFDGGQAVRGQALTLSLTFDHRVVDGAPAGRFLARVIELLERPYLLM